MRNKEHGKEWVAGYNTAPKQNPTHVICNVNMYMYMYYVHVHVYVNLWLTNCARHVGRYTHRNAARFGPPQMTG